MRATKTAAHIPSIPMILVVILALLTTATAQTGSSTTTSAKKRTTATPVTAQEVQDLKQAVASQQQQIKQQNQLVDQLRTQLQQLVDATQQANSNAQKAQSSVDQAASAATQAQQSATDAQKVAEQASANLVETKAALAAVSTKTQDEDRQISALQALVGRFRFSGDVRVRGESYNQDGVPDRNRARIRVRFGVDGQLNGRFHRRLCPGQAGSLGDPSSSNETLTNVFERKTIGLDRGFITYNPVAHHWLSLTGGKFAYTWQRTSVTFDPDINPEGFNQKASFDFSGPIKNFTAQAIELLYSEANGKPGIPSQDSYAIGGQVSARVQFGPWSATPSFTTLKWNRPDAILQESAFAVAATTTGAAATATNPAVGPYPVPGEGTRLRQGHKSACIRTLRIRSQWHDQCHLRRFERCASLLFGFQLRRLHHQQPIANGTQALTPELDA